MICTRVTAQSWPELARRIEAVSEARWRCGEKPSEYVPPPSDRYVCIPYGDCLAHGSYEKLGLGGYPADVVTWNAFIDHCARFAPKEAP